MGLNSLPYYPEHFPPPGDFKDLAPVVEPPPKDIDELKTLVDKAMNMEAIDVDDVRKLWDAWMEKGGWKDDLKTKEKFIERLKSHPRISREAAEFLDNRYQGKVFYYKKTGFGTCVRHIIQWATEMRGGGGRLTQEQTIQFWGEVFPNYHRDRFVDRWERRTIEYLVGEDMFDANAVSWLRARLQ